jgi:hypothetical protein
MTRTARIAALAVALSLLAAAPAVAAKTVNYKGKTTGGHTITFKRQGKKVWWISTMAPTVCLASNRPGAQSRTGAEIYTPPGYEIVGKKVTFEDLQKPAMHYSNVTKHYEITLRSGPKGKLTGDLHLSFSFIVPIYPMPSMLYYGCVGKTKFTASSVKK